MCRPQVSDLVLVPKQAYPLPKAMETKKNSIALCGDTLGYEVVVDWERSREFSVGRETEMSCSGLMVQYTTSIDGPKLPRADFFIV